jgi:hypothetical protein
VSLESIKLVELKRSDELGLKEGWAASAESRTQPPPRMSGQFHFRDAFCFSGVFRLLRFRGSDLELDGLGLRLSRLKQSLSLGGVRLTMVSDLEKDIGRSTCASVTV